MRSTKKSALSLVAAGLGFASVAFLLNAVIAPGPRFAQMFGLAIVFGHTMFVLGCIQLARSKGRPWWYGLLGMLSCVGLAVLWFAIPDAPASTPSVS